MKRPGRRSWRILGWIALSLAVLVLLALLTGYGLVKGSQSRLDGTVRAAGLEQPVTVGRDGLGVPAIAAASRPDALFALGFVHAQDRYFLMDLTRRRAAGRLAELFGPALLDEDRRTRRHDFARRAEAVVVAARPEHRLLLAAYTAGVNAGLHDLRVRPGEYLLLRERPEPWRDADAVLVLYAMFLMLTDVDQVPEAAWDLVARTLPAGLADYLLPRGCRWDAPLQGEPYALSAPPADLDLREGWPGAAPAGDEDLEAAAPAADAAGSNSWAVGGRLTEHGGALLANDLHLQLRVPNTWYRASLRWRDEAGEPQHEVGATLPGMPGLVAGSNTRVAWGLTNSYGDWVDLVVLETDPEQPDRYLTPAGWRTMTERREVIAVRGAPAETLTVRETVWGPVHDRDHEGRERALRWTAHDLAAVNLHHLDISRAQSVTEALAIAAGAGIPPQNFVCAGRDGSIGWIIGGRIPRRVGFDGRRPVSWADGSHRWDGYLEAAEQPRIVDPAEGLLWSANNRALDGDALRTVGDGGYGLGARAAQIRDGLRALPRYDERAMLDLQLDDRALYLAEWRSVLQAALALPSAAPDSIAALRRAFARQVSESWDGHASIGSVGYRLVRHWRLSLEDLVYRHLAAPALTVDSTLALHDLPSRPAVVWDLFERRPANLLPPGFAGWDDVALAAVDTVLRTIGADSAGFDLAAHTWGARNTTEIRHPFFGQVPRTERWLAMAPRALPGDSHLPRVQHPRSGASQRLVVAPGRERHGYYHMPGGQSGHPLSPFYRAGHADWEEGRPTPLLPGEVRHTLTLRPAGADRERVRVATTTSLYDTGLWEALELAFEAETGLVLDVIYAGTGRALDWGRRGDVDVVVTHDAAAESAFVAEGYGTARIPFAYNHFLIVGPADDPAGLAGLAAGDALYRLAELARFGFLSRGDQSGTHAREKLLWAAAGLDHGAVRQAGSWYLEAGLGMGPTLAMAGERRAYTLTDLGTFLAYRGEVALVAVVESGAALRNVYAAIVCTGSPRPKSAQRLVDFLTSDRGQALIGAFGFTPVAAE